MFIPLKDAQEAQFLKDNDAIVNDRARTATNPAFGAYYDLQTDETGATKRLGMTVTLADRERVLSIARDEENMWLVTDHQGEHRAAYNGALDVDVVFSPFFNALPIPQTCSVAGVSTLFLCVFLHTTIEGGSLSTGGQNPMMRVKDDCHQVILGFT